MTAATLGPGLQNERTGLAWQRTMLSGLTCSVLVARLLASVSTTLAVIIGLLALLGTGGARRGWRSAGSVATIPPWPTSRSRAAADPRPCLSGLVVLTAARRPGLRRTRLAVTQLVQALVVDAEMVRDLVDDGDPDLFDHIGIASQRSPGSGYRKIWMVSGSPV